MIQTPEDIASARKAREGRLHDAWMELALSPAFSLVFEQDLQKTFGMFDPAFRSGDGYNTHAAAMRDGQKKVLNFIARRRARGMAMLDADEATPDAKETVSEYQGTPP